MKRLAAFLSLFASMGTLICCALPALLVSMGLGASVAGAVSAVPQLVWLSEQKNKLFALTAGLLAISGWLQWSNRRAACQGTSEQQDVCATSRDLGFWIYWIAVGIFTLGFVFAYWPLWIQK